MSRLKECLGTTVRRLRLAAGYSQEGFADHIKVHRTYMGTVERGEVNLTIENVEKIALGLGLAAWELLKAAAEDEACRDRPRKGKTSLRVEQAN